jgi:hypothetical protein
VQRDEVGYENMHARGWGCGQLQSCEGRQEWGLIGRLIRCISRLSVRHALNPLKVPTKLQAALPFNQAWQGQV